MTPTTVTVPVPLRKGDGGTVHQRPPGTVRGHMGTEASARHVVVMGKFRKSRQKAECVAPPRYMVVLPTDKLLHWFGSGRRRGAWAHLVSVRGCWLLSPAVISSCPKNLGTHANVASRFGARAATMVR